jgi:hypothetical protein
MVVTHAWTLNIANVHFRLGEQWQQRPLRQAGYLKSHAPKLTYVTEKYGDSDFITLLRQTWKELCQPRAVYWNLKPEDDEDEGSYGG